jgi:formate hydrogenlyase transcriptional activator
MLDGMPADKPAIYYEALFELAQSISGHHDLDSLCSAVFRCLKKVIKLDGVGLLLYDEASGYLRMHAFSTNEPLQDEPPHAIPATEENPVGWVWVHQKPVVIPQIDRETRWPLLLHEARSRNFGALLFVPMSVGARCIGVLAFASLSAKEISQDESDFALRVASELAVTVDAFLTQEKYLRERDRLQLLFDVTNSLVSKLAPDALLQELAQQISKVVKCDLAILALLDNITGELVLSGLYHSGESSLEFNHTRVHPEGMPSGQALKTGRPVIVDRMDSDRFPSPAFQRGLEDGFRIGCSIPLTTPNAILGTIDLGRRSGGPFTQEDIDLLVQVSRQIAIALENALSYRELSEMKERLATEKLYLENEIRFDHNLGNMLGESAAFKAVLKGIHIVAPTDATVLILGETGTGKELVARAIHDLSARSKNSFVKVNCAAIPATLLESELFGHEKGSFTGALAQRIGRFELAHEGTLFLDEIGEIPLELQPKLLRAIQEQEFERLGGARTIHANIRFIAASNRDLKAMVDQGNFRSDLYYRLHVFPLQVPPLRERRGDIPMLARYFVQKYAQRIGRKIDAISSSALETLIRYDWPGNVRELQNVIERSVVLTRGPVLELTIPEIGHRPAANSNPIESSASAERERILRALEDAKGRVGGQDGAAARLGLKRTTLQARMRKLGICRGDYS